MRGTRFGCPNFADLFPIDPRRLHQRPFTRQHSVITTDG
jgi:hypothetical protein